MAYWILDKKNNRPFITGSIPKIVEYLHLESAYPLEKVFSREKKNEIDTDDYRIVKFPDIGIKKNKLTTNTSN